MFSDIGGTFLAIIFYTLVIFLTYKKIKLKYGKHRYVKKILYNKRRKLYLWDELKRTKDVPLKDVATAIGLIIGIIFGVTGLAVEIYGYILIEQIFSSTTFSTVYPHDVIVIRIVILFSFVRIILAILRGLLGKLK